MRSRKLIGLITERPKRLRGDTIIEVILCIAVLGTAMAVAYVSTSHSLQVGTDSGNRDRALGLAQQQMEIIKASENNQAALNSYTSNPNTPFCIDPSTLARLPAAHGNYCQVCMTSSGQADANQPYAESSATGCPAGDSSFYFNGLTYDDSKHIFTSNSQWAASNGSGQDQITFYYKLPSITAP